MLMRVGSNKIEITGEFDDENVERRIGECRDGGSGECGFGFGHRLQNEVLGWQGGGFGRAVQGKSAVGGERGQQVRVDAAGVA
jgi:hypothetical protein